MLHMVRGCRVPAPDALEEGFEQKERSFYANLHAEHIEQAMRAFLLRQKEELFFFLELPAAEDEEKKLREEWKKRVNTARGLLPEDQTQAEADLLHTYNRYQIVLDRGEGAYLYDRDGKKYLDFAAGIAVGVLFLLKKKREQNSSDYFKKVD